jgi:XTP/dITP diphosphohydrolase
MAPRRVVLASGNRGKLAEIRGLLEGSGIELLPQSVWEVPEVEETGTTFVENAVIKARHAATLTGLPAIADDSGLEVDALGGAPGVRSARYAGPEADDSANNRLLLERLAGVPQEARTARFRCVMVYLPAAEHPAPLIRTAAWEGSIAEQPSGEGGFGYDPLFLPAGEHGTAAELSPGRKNALSHRGQALRALVAALTVATAHRPSTV